jgi:hypothetical protein
MRSSDGRHSWLDVPLTTGQYLVLDDQSGYRLKSRLATVIASSQSKAQARSGERSFSGSVAHSSTASAPSDGPPRSDAL